MSLKKKIVMSISIILLVTIIFLRFYNKLSLVDKTFYNYLISIKTPIITNIFKIITEFGGAIVISVLGIILLIINRKKGIYYVINILFMITLNLIIKNIVMRERPIGINLITENGYSFPSGHSMISVAAYGLIIYYLFKGKRHKYIKIIGMISSIFLLIFIPVSRVYLGVHFFSDIVAGACISTLWLMIYTNYLNKCDLD